MPADPHLDVSATSPLSWRAVTLGAAVAIALTAIVGTAVSVLIQWALVLRGLSPQAAYGSMFSSPSFIILGHILGAIYNGVGGYTASSLAGSRPIAHGAATGVGGLLFAVVVFAGPISNPLPFWSVALWFLVPIPTAIVGAHLYARQA